jgi:hypothetical protein
MLEIPQVAIQNKIDSVREILFFSFSLLPPVSSLLLLLLPAEHRGEGDEGRRCSRWRGTETLAGKHVPERCSPKEAVGWQRE